MNSVKHMVLVGFVGLVFFASSAFAAEPRLLGTTAQYGTSYETNAVVLGCEAGSFQKFQLAPRRMRSERSYLSDELILDRIVIRYADGSEEEIAPRGWLGDLRKVDGYHRAEFAISSQMCVESITVTGRVHRPRTGIPHYVVVDIWALEN